MFEEEYRQIEGYDNYSVSNHGNVRNDKTRRILKPVIHPYGYLTVILYKECKQKRYLIHRLVGLAFLENPDNLTEIDHINLEKTDNKVSNLRWISRENNCRNRKKWEGTSSKYIGVSWHKYTNKWMASIKLNKKIKYLGYFEIEEDAHKCWYNAVRENNLQEFYGL
jgi:hypothetical protein